MGMLFVVWPLALLLLLGCGGGNAAKDGGAGVGGGGGTSPTDANPDRTCGPPATTYTFATERIREAAGSIGLTMGSDAKPLFYYLGGVVAGQQDVWVVGRPEGGDAGVSVSVGYQLSRVANCGIGGRPVVRPTRNGQVRVVYQPCIAGIATIRSIEWSGDFNQNPTDNPVNVTATPSLMAFDLDAQDRPGILYRNGNGLFLATNAGTGWQSELAWGEFDGDYVDVALTFDAAGVPILFAKPSSNYLYVVTRRPPGWTNGLLDPQNRSGFGAVAARDGLGQIVLMYMDGLRARRVVGVPGAWDLQASVPNIPEQTPGYARSPAAIALGSGGEIHAAYDGNPVLYAYYDGCSWTTQPMGDAAGRVTGIVLDAAARPHVAFEKTATTIELWYASPTP